MSGHSYAFCYLPSIARSLVPVVADLSSALSGLALSPLDLAARVARYFKLPGLSGLLTMAASALERSVGCVGDRGSGAARNVSRRGDQAHPRLQQQRPGHHPEAAADEAEELLVGGFGGMKLRLGRPDRADDLATVRAVRRRLPTDRAHGRLQPGAVLWRCHVVLPGTGRRGRLLDRGADPPRRLRHTALIAQAVKTPIQIGENFTGIAPMMAALEMTASDFVMPDLDRIGGVTGWQRAAGLAAAHNRELSSHLFPEVSVHLLAASPTRHWLEYADWAAPLLQDPLDQNGMAIISDKPGNNLRWDPDAVAKYRLA